MIRKVLLITLLTVACTAWTVVAGELATLTAKLLWYCWMGVLCP